MAHVRPLLAISAAVIILTVPFIRQPFNQDDRDFVEFARASAVDITNLRVSNYTYDGRFFKSFRDPHGPLLTTYLGTSLRTGAAESESLYHGLYLIFPLIAGVSMYFLAGRFTRRPLIAALLMIFTPGFLVLSHTLMDNLPGLALALAAAALYVYGTDRNDIKILAAAGIAIIVAALASYQTLSIVPALAFYGIATKPRSFRKFLPFILILAGGGLWLLATYRIYGRLPAVSYRIRGQAYEWPGYGDDYGIQPRAFLTLLGGITVFPLSLLVAFMRKRIDLAAGAISLTLVTAWVLFADRVSGDADWQRRVLIILLTWTGLMIVYKLAETAVSAARRRNEARMTVLMRKSGFVAAGAVDSWFLLVWFLSVLLGYFLFLIPYVSARHLLLLFPPIILIFVNEADRFWRGRRAAGKIFIAATLVLTLGIALAAAIADYDSAAVYPAAAAELKQELQPEEAAGATLYYRGEFGFRYYLEQQGFQAMNDQTKLHAGDVIVFSALASPARPWPDGNYAEIARLEPGDSFPFRVWNLWAGAGFYTNQMGSLPLVFSQENEDQIIVYRYER